MPENGERELERLFEELRRDDARATPDFRRVLEHPAASTGRPAAALLARVGALGALAAVAIATLLLVRAPSRRAVSAGPPPELAQWRSPTDFLLRTPGSELLESPPAPISPAPDYRDLDRWSSRPSVTTPRPHADNKGERP